MIIHATAALSRELDKKAPTRVLIFPDGAFRARDGRPTEVDAWRLTPAAARRIIESLAARKGEIPIDYEHQILRAKKNGKPAPAAGWFSRAEYVPGEGLYAVDVRWTDRARAMIEAGEYRYISPLFFYDRRTGEIVSLVNFTLANIPAIDGHGDLAAATCIHHQEEPMNAIAKALGLPEDATEEAVLAALSALQDKLEETEAKLDETSAKLAAAANGEGEPDPAKFVPVEQVAALHEQLAALSVDVTRTRVEALVDQAMEEGRLLPAQKEWAVKLGLADLAKLQEFIDNAPPIAGLVSRQSEQAERKEKGELTEEELAICTAMGLSPEDYKQAKEAN